MIGWMRTPARRSALRVAAVATLVAAAAIAIAGVVLDRQQRAGGTADVDSQLLALLNKIGHSRPDAAAIAGVLQPGVGVTVAGTLPSEKSAAADPTAGKAVVTAVWAVDSAGRVIGATPFAPAPPQDVSTGEFPRDEDIGGRTYRLDALAVAGGRVVAAADVGATVTGLPLRSSIAIAFGLLAGGFAATLAIGLRAVAPVERARRAQLDFTADASHELRTPLSVIEAEAALVLRDPGAEDPVAAVERIAHEGRRLRAIVDGLLWLARHDAEPHVGAVTTEDLDALAESAVARFAPVAARRGIGLRLERRGEEAATVRAPDGWVDRLLGVLLDNACRLTPDGGAVVVRLEGSGERVALSVDDSGPGIPEGERARVLRRFHRLDGVEGGSGLGLAIADAVVRGTGGRWSIGAAPEGGASMGVSWASASGVSRRRARRLLGRQGARSSS